MHTTVYSTIRSIRKNTVYKNVLILARNTTFLYKLGFPLQTFFLSPVPGSQRIIMGYQDIRISRGFQTRTRHARHVP